MRASEWPERPRAEIDRDRHHHHGRGPGLHGRAPLDASRVRRLPQRAAYDDASIHAVLDAGLIGHVGIVAGDRPVVIPMLYGRDGSTIYLHGSVASRLLRSLAGGIDLCLTVTLVDGLCWPGPRSTTR